MKRTTPLRPLCIRALLASTLLSLFSLAHAQTSNEPTATAPALFVMGSDATPNSYSFNWFNRIYSEVFRRLGIPFQLESYALKRQGLQIEAGIIDGEANRAYGYGATQPNLVRVEESIHNLTLALYTAKPTLRLQRLDELSTNGMQVEYRRGILLCENALKPIVPAERLSDIPSLEQGVKKLVAQRTDLYCDFSLNILIAMHEPAIEGRAALRKVLDIGSVIPTYPYLHKKHAGLAPRIAAILSKMKAEGLIEAYRLQVEREQGWGQ
ncbi:MAG: hypothetical protein V4858_01860 [Pseudomonadota bacterium]